MSKLDRRMLALPLAACTMLATAALVLAQDEEAGTTISRIEAGEAQGAVSLEGAALEPLDAGTYLFSDGSGVILIDVDPGAGEGELPLFTLMAIEGMVVDDAIDVSAWKPLRIVVPAVIVPEEEVIMAFQEWILAYDGQAPVE